MRIGCRRRVVRCGQNPRISVARLAKRARRLQGSGVSANALHPGAIATRLGRGQGALSDLLSRALGLFMKTPEQGARTSIFLASAPELEGVSGRYFANQREKEPLPHARDDAAAARLWEISEQLTGFRYA